VRQVRLLLINPPYCRYGGMRAQGGNMIPLNLCYLAAYARRSNPGAIIRILDAECCGYELHEVADEAATFGPDLVGITANTIAFDCVTDLASVLRQDLPSAQIVLGGPHVSALPQRSLRETGANWCVVGEGEVTFCELIDYLAGRADGPERIDGLAYIDGKGRFRQTAQRRPIEDLDSLPFPARDLVDNRRYCPPPTKRVGDGLNTVVSTSRGCPHRCGFCAFKAIWGQRVRARSPASVVTEVEECIAKYGVRSINFCDEFFTLNKPRVAQICQLMKAKRLDVAWVCSARAEKLDRQTLTLMREAGCHEISFGIESGDPDTLTRMDKKLDLHEATRVVRAAQRVGITTHASFILGYLGETVDTMKRTIRLAKTLNTDVAAFFVVSPLPGSKLYGDAVTKGYLRKDASWADYAMLSNRDPVLVQPDLPPKVVRRWHRKAIQSYYLRLRYLLARVSRIRHLYEVQNMLMGLRTFIALRRQCRHDN